MMQRVYINMQNKNKYFKKLHEAGAEFVKNNFVDRIEKSGFHSTERRNRINSPYSTLRGCDS